jgi:hypothetical protein
MGHPTSGAKAKVDPKFEDRIKDLEKRAKDFSEHFRNHTKYRKWHTPEKVTDILDVPSIDNPTWDRNDLNQTYSEKIVGKYGDEAGTFGDAMATKWQIDFMAVEERAFRTRHASFIRCAAHAHGRLDGHGQQDKSIFSFLKDGVQAAIDFGAKISED